MNRSRKASRCKRNPRTTVDFETKIWWNPSLSILQNTLAIRYLHSNEISPPLIWGSGKIYFLEQKKWFENNPWNRRFGDFEYSFSTNLVVVHRLEPKRTMIWRYLDDFASITEKTSKEHQDITKRRQNFYTCHLFLNNKSFQNISFKD